VGEDFSADRMAELFLAYLFESRANDRQVRRVASWLGLLILGADKIKDKWWFSRARQLCFDPRGKRYKARFQHRIARGRARRGGIEFVEVAKSQGQPDIGVARQISDLGEAAAFNRCPKL